MSVSRPGTCGVGMRLNAAMSPQTERRVKVVIRDKVRPSRGERFEPNAIPGNVGYVVGLSDRVDGVSRIARSINRRRG